MSCPCIPYRRRVLRDHRHSSALVRYAVTISVEEELLLAIIMSTMKSESIDDGPRVQVDLNMSSMVIILIKINADK